MIMSTHIPVLIEEVIEALTIQPGGRYIDCTLGGGGHASAILAKSSPGGQLLGIEADPDNIKIAREKLAEYGDAAVTVNDNFANLEDIAERYHFRPVHGILFDLGLSSLQLADSGRGFSFQQEKPLDMRFNPAQKTTAADMVNTLSENELNRVLRDYGEETNSRRISAAIVRNRPIRTTLQLANIVEQAVGGRYGRIHPATKTFQALRIVVNNELGNLKSALKQALSLLGHEGRLVVISYHSLEDRIVKQFMAEESRDCICPPELPACICKHKAQLKTVNKKVITPSLAEVRTNPRSRSAKLRVAERIIRQNEKFITLGKSCVLIKVKNKEWRTPVRRNLQKEVITM
ncbi:MAG: 16S rRNA (cytosine(1402)-N(4))-methyltransferase RsmH [Dehalococcoidales bacterium]|nr:16S rRNA (cytosine(1402)-N(4))-methyltransferase RsmH [Dehalococcoidales bacterium]